MAVYGGGFIGGPVKKKAPRKPTVYRGMPSPAAAKAAPRAANRGVVATPVPRGPLPSAGTGYVRPTVSAQPGPYTRADRRRNAVIEATRLANEHVRQAQALRSAVSRVRSAGTSTEAPRRPDSYGAKDELARGDRPSRRDVREERFLMGAEDQYDGAGDPLRGHARSARLRAPQESRLERARRKAMAGLEAMADAAREQQEDQRGREIRNQYERMTAQTAQFKRQQNRKAERRHERVVARRVKTGAGVLPRTFRSDAQGRDIAVTSIPVLGHPNMQGKRKVFRSKNGMPAVERATLHRSSMRKANKELGQLRAKAIMRNIELFSGKPSYIARQARMVAKGKLPDALDKAEEDTLKAEARRRHQVRVWRGQQEIKKFGTFAGSTREPGAASKFYTAKLKRQEKQEEKVKAERSLLENAWASAEDIVKGLPASAKQITTAGGEIVGVGEGGGIQEYLQRRIEGEGHVEARNKVMPGATRIAHGIIKTDPLIGLVTGGLDEAAKRAHADPLAALGDLAVVAGPAARIASGAANVKKLGRGVGGEAVLRARPPKRVVTPQRQGKMGRAAALAAQRGERATARKGVEHERRGETYVRTDTHGADKVGRQYAASPVARGAQKAAEDVKTAVTGRPASQLTARQTRRRLKRRSKRLIQAGKAAGVSYALRVDAEIRKADRSSGQHGLTSRRRQAQRQVVLEAYADGSVLRTSALEDRQAILSTLEKKHGPDAEITRSFREIPKSLFLDKGIERAAERLTKVEHGQRPHLAELDLAVNEQQLAEAAKQQRGIRHGTRIHSPAGEPIKVPDTGGGSGEVRRSLPEIEKNLTEERRQARNARRRQATAQRRAESAEPGSDVAKAAEAKAAEEGALAARHEVRAKRSVAERATAKAEARPKVLPKNTVTGVAAREAAKAAKGKAKAAGRAAAKRETPHRRGEPDRPADPKLAAQWDEGRQVRDKAAAEHGRLAAEGRRIQSGQADEILDADAELLRTNEILDAQKAVKRARDEHGPRSAQVLMAQERLDELQAEAPKTKTVGELAKLKKDEDEFYDDYKRQQARVEQMDKTDAGYKKAVENEAGLKARWLDKKGEKDRAVESDKDLRRLAASRQRRREVEDEFGRVSIHQRGSGQAAARIKKNEAAQRKAREEMDRGRKLQEDAAAGAPRPTQQRPRKPVEADKLKKAQEAAAGRAQRLDKKLHAALLADDQAAYVAARLEQDKLVAFSRGDEQPSATRSYTAEWKQRRKAYAKALPPDAELSDKGVLKDVPEREGEILPSEPKRTPEEEAALDDARDRALRELGEGGPEVKERIRRKRGRGKHPPKRGGKPPPVGGYTPQFDAWVDPEGVKLGPVGGEGPGPMGMRYRGREGGTPAEGLPHQKLGEGRTAESILDPEPGRRSPQETLRENAKMIWLRDSIERLLTLGIPQGPAHLVLKQAREWERAGVKHTVFAVNEAKLRRMMDADGDDFSGGDLDELLRKPSGDPNEMVYALPDEVVGQWKAAMRKPGSFGVAARLVNRAFIRAVLPLSVAWHTGNMIDLATRAAVAGAGPGSQRDFKKLERELRKLDPRLADTAFRLLHGHIVSQGRVTSGPRARDLFERHFPALGAATAKLGDSRVGSRVGQAANAPMNLAFQFAKGYENPLVGSMLGKAARDQAHALGVKQLDMVRLAQRMADDPRLVEDFQKRALDMIGDYTQGPVARMLAPVDPFWSWFKAANKFAFYTLPVKHPYKAAMLMYAVMATRDERERLGLSYYYNNRELHKLGLPQHLTGMDAGALPIGDGRVLNFSPFTSFGEAMKLIPSRDDKEDYEAVQRVLNPLAARVLPFAQRPGAAVLGRRGRLGEVGLAQVRGLVDSEYDPNAGRYVGKRGHEGNLLQSTLQNFVPGASQAHQILLKGQRPDRASSIFHPKAEKGQQPRGLFSNRVLNPFAGQRPYPVDKRDWMTREEKARDTARREARQKKAREGEFLSAKESGEAGIPFGLDANGNVVRIGKDGKPIKVKGGKGGPTPKKGDNKPIKLGGGKQDIERLLLELTGEYDPRTPGENVAVGGAADSDHLTTKEGSGAADIDFGRGEEIARKLGIPTWRPGNYDRHEVTVGGQKFSVQILEEVEGHYDHTHVGLQALGPGKGGIPFRGGGVGAAGPAAGSGVVGAPAPRVEATGSSRGPTKAERRLFRAAANKHGVDPSVLWGLEYAESNHQPSRTSSAGAQGWMQFMPATAAGRGVDPNNRRSAVYGAAEYLSEYKDRGAEGMLRAYNAGGAGVDNPQSRQHYANTLKGAESWGGSSVSGAPTGGGSVPTTSSPGGGAAPSYGGGGSSIPAVRPRGGGGPAVASVGTAGAQRFNRAYPEHGLGGSGAKLSELQVRRIAESLGATPTEALQYAQIARGESGYHPGIRGDDPGGTKGWGLTQITPGVQGAQYHGFMRKNGWTEADLRNPVVNLKVAMWMNKITGGNFSPWKGTRYLDRSLSGVQSAGTVDLDAQAAPATMTAQTASTLPARLSAVRAFLSGKTDAVGFVSQMDTLRVEPAVPGPAPSEVPATPAAPVGPVVKNGGGRATVKGSLIGTPYSGTHTIGNWQSDNAVDIGVPFGSPIYALADGRVAKTGGSGNFDGRFGGYNTTLQGQSNAYFYTHLSKLKVAPGQRVRKGQLIGYSGKANGVDHLHLGVENGDPRRYA